MSIILRPSGRIAVTCHSHQQMSTAAVLVVLLLGVITSVRGQQQSCPGVPLPLVCTKLASGDGVPQLDANLSDWVTNGATSLVTPLIHAITNEQYDDGEMTIQCRYSDSSTSTGGAGQLYLAIQVPGLYRFNAMDNHQSASIGTMMKMGLDATYVNMGGCPDASGTACELGVPDACDSYRVDIYHWELESSDQYAVSPSCRFDDDDGDTANGGWSAAWSHTNPVDGEPGAYIFELSRPLTTASTETDAQLVPGGTYSVGVAFWDPYESAEGWTDSGHYVTGCGTDWFELKLDGDTGSGTGAANDNTDIAPPVTVSAPSPILAPVAVAPNLAPVAPSPRSAPVAPSPNLAPVAPSPRSAPVAPSPNSASSTAAPRYYVALVSPSVLAMALLIAPFYF